MGRAPLYVGRYRMWPLDYYWYCRVHRMESPPVRTWAQALAGALAHCARAER